MEKGCTLIKEKELQQLKDLETVAIDNIAEQLKAEKKLSSERFTRINELEKELRETKKPDEIQIDVLCKKWHEPTSYRNYYSSGYYSKVGESISSTLNLSQGIRSQLYRIIKIIREKITQHHTDSLKIEVAKAFEAGQKHMKTEVLSVINSTKTLRFNKKTLRNSIDLIKTGV